MRFLRSGAHHRFLFSLHLESRILKSLFLTTLIMPRLTNIQRAQIVGLLDKPGQSAAALARRFGVAKSTVNRLRLNECAKRIKIEYSKQE